MVICTSSFKAFFLIFGFTVVIHFIPGTFHFLTEPGFFCCVGVLFNEEAGLVIEVAESDVASIIKAYSDVSVPIEEIGTVSAGDSIKITVGSSAPCIKEKMTVLCDLWEATSFKLEHRQRNPKCVIQEEEGLKLREAPQWKLTYDPKPTNDNIMKSESKHKVAILCQEGSNGDREMILAFISAGFDAWDVTVKDLLERRFCHT